MKKYALTLIVAGMLVFGATSCNDAEHADTNQADSTTMSAETTLPAAPPATGGDTTITAPIDPAMDTSASQTPKI